MGKAGGGFRGGLDIRRVLKKYLKNWYLFVIALILAYLFAMDRNRYVVPLYRLSTSVLIEDKSNKSVLDQRGPISADPLFLNSKLIENQIAILQSFSQIRTILSHLDFTVSYFVLGKYTWEEIYKHAPFTVITDTGHNQARYERFDLKFISRDQFQIWSETYTPFKTPQTHRINEQISGNGYSFQIRLKQETRSSEYVGQIYGFMLNELSGLTSQYRSKTTIETSKGTSVIVISSTGPNIEKEKDYLNELTRVFLTSNLEKKNKILINTIDFINSQLSEIGKELDSTEQRLEEFRKNNKFMQLSAKAAMILNEMNSQSKERANLIADLRYYEYLLNYIQNHDSFEDVVMPSTVGLSLPLFSDLVLKLSTVTLEKENLIANSSRQNPYIETLEEQIINMKIALKENMKSIIQTTNIQIDDFDKRLADKNEEFAQLPGIERAYLEIERKYKVFNTLYDFLLQRKSEVDIQRAASTPDHEIIDYAGDTGVRKVSASPKTAYINAFIWALVIPALFLFLVVILNNRVMTQEDIEAYSDIPVIGILIRNTDKRTGKVLLHASSQFTEVLRMIKIKLNLDPVKGEQVILVTSSMAEEGKTYFAENLASIYAHAGKKTLLMGFDFHHPVIAESFDLAGDEGITNYLIHDIPLEKVIRKTFTKNLDILLPGPVPPTSDELIESDKNKQLFTELRRRYEFIIMDTPPLGMVGDAFLLNRFSDVTLFMVRYNFSVKKQFAKAIGEAAENGMKRIMIVFTDIKLKVKIKDINFADEKKSGKNLILMIIMQIRKGVIYLLRKF